VAPSQPAYSRLTPGYSNLAPSDVRGELARLRAVPSARGYHDFYSALDLLSPDLRAGGRSGLRAAPDAAGRARVARALPLVRSAAERVPEVAILHVYHALVAAHACHLDEARAALAQAGEIGQSREQLLIAQEIALRSRELASVRTFLREVAEFRAAREDPWLDAIERALVAPPSCP
jgi:hypothetical protein